MKRKRGIGGIKKSKNLTTFRTIKRK